MVTTNSNKQSNSVSELKFTSQDSHYPFVKASGEESCQIELAEMFPRPNGQYAEFFSVTGADPIRIGAHAAGSDSVESTILSENNNGGMVEFRVSGECPAFRLTELGALPRKVSGDDGRGCIIAEVPAENSASEIGNRFLAEHPAFELVSKREKSSLAPRFPQSAFKAVLHNHLTDRQQEVIQTAFEEGYYDLPRECTGEDVAERLDIASPTFSEHIRTAERKLISLLFEGQHQSTPETRN